MEEMSETRPEEKSDSESREGGESQKLDEVTLQPETMIEREGDIEVAEGIETAFVSLMDQMTENLQAINAKEEEEEDGDYKVKVKFPWFIGEGEGEWETDWVRVGSLMTDGQGSWFMPEISDSVAMDSDQEIPPPQHIRPLDEGTDERQYDSQGNAVEFEEIKYDIGVEGAIGEFGEDQELDTNTTKPPHNLEFNSLGSVVASQTQSYDIKEGDELKGYGEKLVNDAEKTTLQQEKNDVPESYLENLDTYERDTGKIKKDWWADDEGDPDKKGGNGDEAGNGDSKDD